MPETVFYAWQSDRPSSTNRRFVREAIDQAIGIVNAQLGVEDALRGDQDTQGTPGDVNIAEVIFAKIDRCRIFVADVTTVTPSGASRPSPNPNVLVEYGRASVRPGSSCIVTVFNQAFGDWERDRPFDLRHRRKPVTYELPEAHAADQRTEARSQLALELASIFRAILSVSPESVKSAVKSDFESLRHLYAASGFQEPRPRRTLGFWFGLIPLVQMPILADPWNHPQLFCRRARYSFRLGAGNVDFRTMDHNTLENLGSRRPELEPRQNGARQIYRGRHTPDYGRSWCEDIAALYVNRDGSIATVVRTDNVEPPHLNQAWILAEIANALSTLHAVRTYLQQPVATYSAFLELRYDNMASQKLELVSQGEWRLCNIDDETGRIGPPVQSPILEVGPIQVTNSESFSSVLQEAYVQLITSVGRRPLDELSFTLSL